MEGRQRVEEVQETLDLAGDDVELLAEETTSDTYGADGRYEVITRMQEDALGRIRYFAIMLNEVNPYGREGLFRWDVSHLHLHRHNLMAYGAEAPAESMMALDRVEQIQKAYEMAYEEMLQAIHDLAD